MITEQEVIALINEQQVDRLINLEVEMSMKDLSDEEKKVLEFILFFEKSRKEIFDHIDDLAWHSEGQTFINFDHEIFSVDAEIYVNHIFSEGDLITPASHEIDYKIKSIKITCDE